MRQFNLKTFLFVITQLLLISSCSQAPAELQIRSQMENMQQAITDKSLSRFMSYFTKNFKGNKTLTRNDLRRLIFFQFQRNRNIETYKWQADINIENDIAEVEIYVVVSGSNKTLPERGRVYTITSIWEKRDDSWLINSAKWTDTISNNYN